MYQALSPSFDGSCTSFDGFNHHSCSIFAFRSRDLNPCNRSMNVLNNKVTNELTSGILQSAATTEEAWILHVKEIIQQGIFRSELSVSWVANACHFSERHFSRKVRLLTGYPPSKLILETKLLIALNLLKDRRVTTVKEVAAMLHFSDVKYFSRRFQKQFGHYPSQCFQS